MRNFREHRIINRRNRYLREAKYQAIDLKSLLGTVFNLDWLDTDFAIENNLKESFNYFVSDFTDWLIENDYSIADDNSQPKLFNLDYDVNDINKDNISDILEEYLNDDKADRMWFDDIVEKEIEWLEEEYEHLGSSDNLDSLYLASSAATDIDFYIQDIEYSAKESYENLGFDNVEDCKEAIENVCYDKGVEDIESYDAGSYGRSPDYEADKDDEYIIVGTQFLGNTEQEEELWEKPFIDGDSEFVKYYTKDYHSIEEDTYLQPGNRMYIITDLMYVYGVKVKDVLEEGKKLGYL